MGRVAAADGIQGTAATPHLREDFPDVVVHELRDRCAELNTALAGRGVTLEVVPGAEVDAMWARAAPTTS